MSTDVGMRIARSELKNAFFAPTIFFHSHRLVLV